MGLLKRINIPLVYYKYAFIPGSYIGWSKAEEVSWNGKP